MGQADTVFFRYITYNPYILSIHDWSPKGQYIRPRILNYIKDHGYPIDFLLFASAFKIISSNFSNTKLIETTSSHFLPDEEIINY